MPAVTNGSATATKPASKRFELPALNFKFASLTEGTDIPPPLPSPIEEEKPVLKTAAQTSTGASADKSKGNANAGVDAPGSIPRPDSRSDMSTLDDRKSRRSSGWFRRLRGAEGYSAAPAGGMHSSSSPLSKRSSVIFTETSKPAGPPPPMIPELGELQAKIGLDDGSSLGNDLFKNIK